MIDEKIIENVENVLLLVERKILTKEEVRKMLGLKPKTSTEIEVDGIKYQKKED